MITSSVGLKTHIWNNNIKSTLLLACFPLLLLSMIWLAGFLSSFFSGDSYSINDCIMDANLIVINTWFYALCAAGAWFVIAFFYHQSLINAASGGVIVERKDHPRIYNLLEGLCISRGLEMPKIAIINSAALNAFASGISKKSYTITLTQGIIDKLNDQELESVLGHELTHIVNKDVRLLVVSTIFVGIIAFLAEIITRGLFRSRGGDGKKDFKLLFIAIIVLLIGYFFAVIVRFAISRKREYLADAGSVYMTKNPDSMISALRKIAGNADVENMKSSIQQMCIEKSSKFSFGAILFATHPPIEKRIEALRKFAGGQ